MTGIILQITQTAVTVADTINHVANQVVNQPITQPKEEAISIMNLVVKGGWIMIPIVILSLITVYVFIERYIAIKKSSRGEINFMDNIRDFIVNDRLDAALSLCKSTNSPTARMTEKGLQRLGRPLNEIGESIEIVGKFEVYKLEKNLAILAIVAGIAPMFGFIGTIIGVIKIFHDISLAGDVSISSVSSGLYTKMVSSASGLIVGIVAFICYHWLNIMIEKIVQKMEYNAMNFIDFLQEPTR
ncbi:MAG: MotA/TolQ/ExbB proton channel family protein [Bacteroidetes bacterium]|nr:MotA/TolQ/ExbB proton channel family protein [Bacteroidota bacterium]